MKKAEEIKRDVETAVAASTRPAKASEPGTTTVASPSPTGASKTYLEAKLGVWKACPYLLKKSAGGLKYTFASEADLIALVRPALIEHGVLVTPVSSVIESDTEFKTTHGTVMRRVVCRKVYRFTHVWTGEGEDVEMHGEGADVGDKACNKAMTDAFKYAIRQWAMIETGDDPDKQASELYSRTWEDDKGEDNAEPAVPAKLADSYEKCKAALGRAEDQRHLDQYRAIYTHQRGFPPHVVAHLDKLYLVNLDRIAKTPPPATTKEAQPQQAK